MITNTAIKKSAQLSAYNTDDHYRSNKKKAEVTEIACSGKSTYLIVTCNISGGGSSEGLHLVNFSKCGESV